MRKSILSLMTLGILTLSLLSAVASAQDAAKPAAQPTAQSPKDSVVEAQKEVEGFWDPSAILKMAVNNLAKRYNLNDEQKAFTDRMMTERVTGFIQSHQAEVWPLLRNLIIHQRNGAPPDEETQKQLGPVAMKIIKEAKEEIYRSNAEWREILTDDQKKMHDFDLREMGRTFELMEGNFSAWSEGKGANANIFPQQEKAPNEPRIPTKPRKPGTVHEKPEEDPELDVQFDVYAAKFIDECELMPNQVEAANSILREVKQRAAAFRQTNAEKIEEIKTKLNESTTVADRREWNRKRQEFMKPISDLFVELKDRLEQIPDEAQRQRRQTKLEHASAGGAVSSTVTKRPAAPTPAPAPQAPAPANPPKDEKSKE